MTVAGVLFEPISQPPLTFSQFACRLRDEVVTRFTMRRFRCFSLNPNHLRPLNNLLLLNFDGHTDQTRPHAASLKDPADDWLASILLCGVDLTRTSHLFAFGKRAMKARIMYSAACSTRLHC
jgi:hypothetical protein